MKKCPRCHSSMILTEADASTGTGYIWYCIGCGRELLLDPTRQAEDERMRDQIRELAVVSGQPPH